MSRSARRSGRLLGLPMLSLALLGACAIGPGGNYGRPAETVAETEPPPGSNSCRLESPPGSNIRQRVCYRVLTPGERQEETAFVRSQLEQIRNGTARRVAPASEPNN